MVELNARTALVTGAAKRLGKAIVLGLAKQGTNIVLHYDKSEDEVQNLNKELHSFGVKSWLVRASFKNAEACEALINEAFKRSGKIDILINNASVFYPNRIETVKIEDMDADMLVNAWTPFLLSRLFAEKTESGKIINLLDTRISGYDFNNFAYYVSKKMLEILTKSTALKFAPKIAVNAVAPGLILPPEGKDYKYLEQRKDTVPLKKYGSPADVVDTVLFLLKNDFVTGQIVYVDGGKHLVQTLEGL